ncbi:MAG: TlpA family protein disulfide reductase [Candidatus Eremiobacteraeota bacterium]|nr:TlpA family protein disulfide reductase [Candidatus Eremiobacteraeota bacterium]
MPRALVIAALVFLNGCYNAPDPGKAGNGGGPGALAGAPAQSFDVRRTDGRTDSLARHRGQVVLMNLWATWCPPCREEMPALQRFARENAGKVVVLGVDQGESSAAAAAFARQFGVTFPILVDEQQQYGRAYQGIGLPTTVIVARDGRVVRGIDGALTLEQMRAAVAPALAAK